MRAVIGPTPVPRPAGEGPSPADSGHIMRASVVMFIAVILYIIARWARNEPAVTLASVLGGAFAIFVIALLDHGRTEEIARGFAWLFAIVAAYAASPGFFRALGKAGQDAGQNARKTVQKP